MASSVIEHMRNMTSGQSYASTIRVVRARRDAAAFDLRHLREGAYKRRMMREKVAPLDEAIAYFERESVAAFPDRAPEDR
jgi:hypothetical protein